MIPNDLDSFGDQPMVSPLPPKRRYVLSKSFWFDLPYPKDEGFTKLSAYIPKGFVFDGASIPRFFWRIIDTPFSPFVLRAALVHDYIYRSHHIDKESADELFYSMLLEDGNSQFKAVVMYQAVKWFGLRAWNKGVYKNDT